MEFEIFLLFFSNFLFYKITFLVILFLRGKMIKIGQALQLLNGADRLESRSSKLKSIKGFQLRTILLLVQIAEQEGENQAKYRDIFDWTASSISAHTRTLLEYGFIIQGDDERDPRHQSKRIYLAEGVKEALRDELGIDI